MRNTTHYRRIAAAFYGQPLAILPSKLAEILAFLELKFQGGEVEPAKARAIAAQRRGGGVGVQMAGRVGLVPVIGVLAQRGGGVTEASEQIVSCEETGAALDNLVADKACKAVCMLFDSPGGSVYGIKELGDKINSLKSEKKIVGMVDSVCASAAYWLATQCTELNCTPGGQCGSIGVLAPHEDRSGEADQAGVKTTLVSSSKYKTEGHPFGPLDDEARQELQSKVDAYHAMFVAAVARGRNTTEGVVNKTYGQGRMLTAQQARAAGMIDHVRTFAAALNSMGAGGSVGASAARLGRAEVQARLKEIDRQMAQEGTPPSSGSLGWREARDRAREIERELAAGGNGGRDRQTREEVLARVRQVERECGLTRH